MLTKILILLKIKYIQFTEKQYDKLLEKSKKLNQEFYEMVLFTLRTGVRVGELKALQWENVDFENKNVTIK